MKRIFKYNLDIINTQTLSLPRSAIVRSVGNQYEKLMIWVEVEDAITEEVEQEFYIVGTGRSLNHIPDTAQFLGTVFFSDGRLIFHVYKNNQFTL